MVSQLLDITLNSLSKQSIWLQKLIIEVEAPNLWIVAEPVKLTRVESKELRERIYLQIYYLILIFDTLSEDFDRFFTDCVTKLKIEIIG